MLSKSSLELKLVGMLWMLPLLLWGFE